MIYNTPLQLVRVYTSKKNS